MPRKLILPILCAALACVPPLAAQKVPVTEKFLPNGMKLLLVERHDEPSVAGGWVVRVGSANERPGITGIAHLFEHMMFKGTPTIGTKDAARDLSLIAEQEAVRAQMREEEAAMRAAWRRGEIEDLQKPETKSARWKELEVKFQELVKAQRDILVKNEFDRIYTAGGASGMNAFTTEDMTGYFITVPANKLELWCWMESERLLRPVFREFYAERDVVFEERRLRTESTPLGKFQETLNSMIWEAHPYGWPVVGWASDIPAITKAQADEFFATYYAPQNITLILVGDFKADAAVAMCEKYFGRIPRGKVEPPDVLTLEPRQGAEKRMNAEAEANPQVDVVWQTVPFGHRDSHALTVLGQLLSTRTGRLHKGLVLGSKVATDTSAGQQSQKWAGLFYASGECAEGKTPAEVEQAIYAELEKLRTEPVPEQELQKVKNNFAAAEYRRLSANFPILRQIIFAEGLGGWREINEAGPKIQAVTTDDVRRVVGAYLKRETRTVATYTRKPGVSAASDDPDLAGLSAKQLPAVRQFLNRLKEEKNVETLRERLKQMEAQSAKADAKDQPFMKILKKKTEERIGELEGKKVRAF